MATREYVKQAFMGYTRADDLENINWTNSFVTGKTELIVVECSQEIENAIKSKDKNNESLRISPFLKTFGLPVFLQAKKNELKQKVNENLNILKPIEKQIYLKLYIEFIVDDESPPEVYSFIKNYAYVKIEGNEIVESVENKEDDDQNPFMVPPQELVSTSEKGDEGGDKSPLSASIDWLGKIGTVLGIPQDKVDSATKWVKENPGLTGVLAATVLPRVFDFVTGKKADLSFSGLGIDAAKGLGIAMLLNHFLGDKAPPIGGGTTSGAGGSGFLGGVFSSYSGVDYLEYDGGAARDEQTAQLQRCLIRLGKGNLAAERMNLQPPKYTPIVGVKISGKKNYADDGRFGKWTLDAATSLFKQINVINKTDIEKDPTLEIKDPNKIPLKVLYSAACQDETGASVTPDETKGAEAMKALEESKIYKDFSFLSSKNQKLHATLMEQLRKDLKRG
jgi:hypothetical protein